MSDLLDKIYQAQLIQGNLLGKMQSKLDTIDANCRLCSTQYQQIGQRIVLSENGINRHEKKISDIYHRLETTEVTGVKQIVKQETQWKTLTVIGAIILGFVSALAGLFSILKAWR